MSCKRPAAVAFQDTPDESWSKIQIQEYCRQRNTVFTTTEGTAGKETMLRNIRKAVESCLLSTLPERDAVRKFYIKLRDLKKKLGSDWLPKPRKEHSALYKKMGAFRSLYLRKACSQKITRKPLSLEQSWLLSLLPGVLGDDVLASILHLFGTCVRPHSPPYLTSHHPPSPRLPRHHALAAPFRPTHHHTPPHITPPCLAQRPSQKSYMSEGEPWYLFWDAAGELCLRPVV